MLSTNIRTYILAENLQKKIQFTTYICPQIREDYYRIDRRITILISIIDREEEKGEGETNEHFAIRYEQHATNP